MEQLKPEQLKIVFNALEQPAFAVKGGLVCYANPAFSALQIGIGTPLHSFFGARLELPVDENTALDCTVAGLPCTATVFPMEGGAFYLLRMQEQSVSAHALSHTVKSIRSSLHNMYSAAAGLCEEIEETGNEKTQVQAAGMLQEIYYLEHTVQNIDLLQKLLCGSYTLKPEKTDAINYLSQLFSHAEELLRYAGICLTAELPKKLFNGNLDHSIAETVIWNALSNAAANTKDGSVLVRVRHQNAMLQLTFVNRGTLSAQTQRLLFSRYQVPIEEALSETGAGFGLSVIRQAAVLHGGTVLFAAEPKETVLFTVTFDLSKKATAEVCSPMPVISGLDQGLVHLSSVLPRSAYDSRDIL